jgi:hypothetical protein
MEPGSRKSMEAAARNALDSAERGPTIEPFGKTADSIMAKAGRRTAVVG